jgi:hypothetical protein
MFFAYRAATLDIITEYLFGHCQNNVDYPDFEAPLLIAIQTSVPMSWLLKSFPFIVRVLPFLPRWLAPSLHGQSRAFCSLQEFLVSSLDRSRKEAKAFSGLDHLAICHHLLEPLCCPPPVLFTKLPWLDEVLSLIQAGSDTVGNTCTIGTLYVLNEKSILSKLTEELRSVWPESDDCIDVAILQTLPYLVSIFFFVSVWGSSERRCLPQTHRPPSLKKHSVFLMALSLLFRGLWVPWVRKSRGSRYRLKQEAFYSYELKILILLIIFCQTVVGISVTAVHLDASLFPNPDSFVPERWLDPSAADLDRYLVSFSKGPRTCLGIRYVHVCYAALSC